MEDFASRCDFCYGLSLHSPEMDLTWNIQVFALLQSNFIAKLAKW